VTPAHRALAGAAVVLGALAPFAGSPYRAAHAGVDIRQLAAEVAREEDHVTAIELAAWIKDRKPGLRILDLRTPEEFDEYHLPRAENVPLEALTATRFAPDDTLVLISAGGAHAAQGWVFLRALGNAHVFFLRGGLQEWLDDVMNPVFAANAPAETNARIAALSRYFGGVPRRGGVATGGAAPAQPNDVTALRRRGC
jgi:rhodanese-related sulfurtransferase